MRHGGRSEMSAEALNFIKAGAVNSGGRLTAQLSVCRAAARAGGIAALEAEILALENGICPSRYERNIGTIGLSGQVKLLRSSVAVVGCGGLGGWVVEMLARAGVGALALFDGDVFDESNLNRQLFANEENIGMSKADAAAERVKMVNSTITARAYQRRLTSANALNLLSNCGVDVVVDALDNNSSRHAVFMACRELGVPFVHGAVGGFFSQVGVCYPEDNPPWLEEETPDKGVETETGTPPFTPPFVAALQVAETVKILVGLKGQLRGELLWFDLKRHDRKIIKLTGVLTNGDYS